MITLDRRDGERSGPVRANAGKETGAPPVGGIWCRRFLSCPAESVMTSPVPRVLADAGLGLPREVVHRDPPGGDVGARS
jgi:hypothetical protein